MSKGLLQSKTIWGIILLIAGPLLAKYGITSDDAQHAVSLITEAVGAVIAIYGRIVATKPIGGVVTGGKE